MEMNVPPSKKQILIADLHRQMATLLKSMRNIASAFINTSLYDQCIKVLNRMDKRNLTMSFIESSYENWTEIGGLLDNTNRGNEKVLIVSLHSIMTTVFGKALVPSLESINQVIKDNKNIDIVQLNHTFDLVVELIKTSIIYVHQKRKPSTTGNPPTPCYSKHYYSKEINLQSQAKLYRLTFDWTS